MIIDSLKEMEKFLIEFYTRSENSRNKILLTSKLDEIEAEYISMLYRENVLSDDVGRKFESIYRAVNEVLNRLPIEQEFDSIRLGLLSISNRSLVDYSSVFLNASIEKIYSSANILAELLMGVLGIEELPDIPSPKSPEYEKIVLRYLSSIVSASELYATAVQIIPIISDHDLVRWTNEVLKRFDRMYEVFHEVDCQKILDRYRKLSKIDILIFNLSSCIRLVAQVFKLLEYLFRAFGDNWPDGITTSIHFPSHDVYGLYKFIEDGQAILGKLQLVVNDIPPHIQERYKNSQGEPLFGSIEKVLSLFQQTIIKFQILDSFEGKTLKIHDLDASIESLELQLDSILHGGFLSQGSTLVEWSQAMYIYDDLIMYYVIRALMTRDYYTFRSHIDTYLMQSFFNRTELFSESKFNAIIADLYITIAITNSPDLMGYKETLENEISRLHSLSHLIIPYTVLIQIIRSKLNEDVEDICNTLDNLHQMYFAKGNLHHLSEEFRAYIETLKNCLWNRAPSWGVFSDRTQKRLPELRTWVVPDFTRIPEKRLRPSMRYIPFNFIRDRIQAAEKK